MPSEGGDASFGEDFVDFLIGVVALLLRSFAARWEGLGWLVPTSSSDIKAATREV
jgi:hypothetical protein